MYTAEIAGPANSLLLLLDEIEPDYQSSLLLPQEGPLCIELKKRGIQYHVVPKMNMRTIPQIWHVIRSNHIDLVYGNNPSGRIRNSLIAAKLAGKPVIWHFRIQQKAISWRHRIVLGLADAVIAVSEGVAESIYKFVPSVTVKVVYNGVEPALFARDREPTASFVRQSLNLPSNAQIVTMVGNITYRKQQLEAVKAFALVNNAVSRAHLVLAGSIVDSAYYNEIVAYIKSEGLSEKIHLIGFCNDVPGLLSASDVYIHTSRREGHPRAVIEAMAASLPIVAFDIDGVRECIKDGRGIIVPQGRTNELSEHIISLLVSPSTRDQYGKRAHNYMLSNYTAQQTAQQIKHVIAQIVR